MALTCLPGDVLLNPFAGLVISCRGGLSKQSCSQFIHSASEYYPKDPGNSITQSFITESDLIARNLSLE